MATGQTPTQPQGQLIRHPASQTPAEPEVQDSTLPDGSSPDMQQSLLTGRLMLERYLRTGPNPEYQKYAASVRMQTDNRNTFDFVMDAIEGAGGFEDGMYLDPHYREISGASTGVGGALLGGIESRKFWTRRRLSDYDNFVKPVCDTYWNYIQQSRDQIRRTTTDDRLDRFWEDCDLKRTAITDFMGAPARQARAFGTGVVMIDRPNAPIYTEKDNQAEENRPYAYLVPTRNIVDWRLDDDGRCLALVILEPEDEDAFLDTAGTQPQPVRVWTSASWAVWKPTTTTSEDGESRITYALDSYGPNPLGEIPAVFIYNEPPLPGCFFGKTEMKDVALIGKTVYNIDSEIREVERNCAFPVFCVPMKDPSTIQTLVISTEGALGYDGDRGSPAFVSANLDVLSKLQDRRDKKVAQAYSMAHLGIISGFVKTTSGFHSQAEFDQSNRQIGTFAAALEEAEMKIARLVLRWYGVTDDQIRSGRLTLKAGKPGTEGQELFTISYPRNFGLRDLDAVVLRAVELLSLGLGREANEKFLSDMFDALYPRWTEKQVQDQAKAAATYLEQAGVVAPGGIGVPNSGLRSGVKGVGGPGDRMISASDTKLMRLRRMINQVQSMTASGPAAVTA